MCKFLETGEITINIGSDFGKCFIYFLLQGEEVVYVGQTRKGLSRPFNHDDKIYNSIKIIKCDEKDLDRLESYFIEKYAPKYNKTIGGKTLFSLYTARNKIRQETKRDNITIPQLRHLLKSIGIDPTVINKAEYINTDDLNTVIRELGGCYGNI